MTGSDPGPTLPPGPPLLPPPPPTAPPGPSGPSGQALPPGEAIGPGPHRLHPSSPVLGLVLSARQWALPLIVVIVASEQAVLFGPGALLLLALVVGWLYVAWSRFSYEVRDGVLVIDKGVLQRHHREVPIARIQQVDLRRKLRHRALGVAVVRIDTAGGGAEAEVVLEAIADRDALQLRSTLLSGRSSPAQRPGEVAGEGRPLGAVGEESNGPPPAVAVPVVELSTRDLVVAGISGSRLAAVLPFAAAAVGLLFELPGSTSEQIIDAVPTGTVAVVLFGVAVAPLVVLAAVASSILTDHGFTLVRVGSDLHVRRGLLDQREATVSLHRIQAVRIRENIVRRPFGLASVQLQSAGSGHEAEGDVTRLTIPLVRAEHLQALLPELLPTDVDHPPLIPAPSAARRRSWVRHVVPVLIVLVPLVVWASLTTTALAAIALLLVAPFAVAAELAYRHLGHVATPGLVVASSGAFDRETILVPVSKTQSTTLRSSPFQRRAGLATLQIEVAGRGATPRILDGEAGRLARLRVGALHATAARDDEGDVRTRLRAERT